MKRFFSILIALIAIAQFLYSQNCTQCDNTGNPSGTYASEIGENTTATGDWSFSGGYSSESTGVLSFSFGANCYSTGSYSVTLGHSIKSNGLQSMVIGTGAGNEVTELLTNNISQSLMIGFNSEKPTFFVGHSNGVGTTGRIGIGNVTDPQAKLHIKGDDNENADILLEPASTKYAKIKFGGTANRIEAKSTLDLNFHTASDFVFWDGNMGIGNYNPAEKLDVAGNIKTTGFILNNGQQAANKILQSDANGLASWVDMPEFDDGDWIINGNDVYRMNGNVGIGTSLNINPNNYKLAVNGIIGTKEIYIENTSLTWPDFVFSDQYCLPSLYAVEEYIKENKHLPDVPSSSDVQTNGLKLAEINTVLLQKIEELTLYIIDLKKDNDEMKKMIESYLYNKPVKN